MVFKFKCMFWGQNKHVNFTYIFMINHYGNSENFSIHGLARAAILKLLAIENGEKYHKWFP